MNDNITALENEALRLGCKVMKDEPLAKYTTFKIGGKARLIILPCDEHACAYLVKTAVENNIKYFVLGNGSNILCSDKGYDGVIFMLGAAFRDITLSGENIITAGAGASLAGVCIFAQRKSLSGLEFAFGIPGTIGGAIYMNAGAYGGEIGLITKEVRALDKSGNLHRFKADQIGFGYRKSLFQNDEFVIVGADFKLIAGDKDEISAKMNELMEKRREKQPLEYPSAGSTFKRPAGQFAGKLIEDCGLRGYSIGGAQVSEKHCGFIINKDNAAFDDVMKLITYVQQTVLEKTGYNLECEVRILK